MKTLIAALVAAGIALPASAQEIRFEVVYRDLDLASATGQKELDRRIDSAARKACDLDTSLTGTRIRSSHKQECYAEMKAKAKQQFATLIEQDGRGG